MVFACFVASQGGRKFQKLKISSVVQSCPIYSYYWKTVESSKISYGIWVFWKSLPMDMGRARADTDAWLGVSALNHARARADADADVRTCGRARPCASMRCHARLAPPCAALRGHARQRARVIRSPALPPWLGLSALNPARAQIRSARPRRWCSLAVLPARSLVLWMGKFMLWGRYEIRKKKKNR